MARLYVDVVTPSGAVVENRAVDEVTAPGSEGEFTVLPGHTPFLTALKPGGIRLRFEGEERWLAVSRGFAEITADRIIILARTCEAQEEIDQERALEALKRAEERLTEGGGDMERARASLLRASVRLRIGKM